MTEEQTAVNDTEFAPPAVQAWSTDRRAGARCWAA